MASRRSRLIQRREAVGHTQESLAEALDVDRTTVGRWESGRGAPQPWMRPKLARALKLSVDQLADLLASPPPAAKAVPPSSSAPLAPVRRTGHDNDLVSAVAADSEESALFLRFASASNVDDTLLEQTDADIARLAGDYVSKPVSELFHDIGALRRGVFDLLRGRQHPHQTSHLYLQAGRLCGLATHVALDLGQYAAAATHSRTAWRCAESAGHNGLRAWIRSVQSLIAYWQQDHRQAAELARAGLPYADSGTIAARLLSLEARATAALGDTASALRAVEAAEAARSTVVAVDLPGVFTFPEAKQWTYAGTALLALGTRSHVNRAIEASSRAIALYESAPQQEQSSGDLLAARLDLANAHLAHGDLDGVQEKLLVVLDAAPDRRTASISSRLRALSTRLAEPAYAGSPIVLGLRENVREACSRPALTNPPELPQ
ncbi:helix-turn-helix transcriptional regulator [Kitasatospora sp. NBC_01300]|uniref:helix-turn-helix transcriptional regulator n=1 Tax=Kitasatospora sp. NBC_01300 TaxID=2903574 RepID=UPI00352F4091|nr:helix-turn-helix domain-containing protein [Kitasatospora sp. NBC_01300]